MSITKFTIERSRWARGAGLKPGTYLMGNGGLCCLGFCAKACGADDEDISGHTSPSDVATSVDWPSFLITRDGPDVGDSQIAHDLMRINDRDDITEERRESAVADTFAQHGITVEFVP